MVISNTNYYYNDVNNDFFKILFSSGLRFVVVVVSLYTNIMLYNCLCF